MDKDSGLKRFEEVVNMLIEQGMTASKADLARTLGVHPQIIYDTISGRLSMSGKLLLRMEQIYGINRKYVLSGEEPVLFDGASLYKRENSNWQGLPKEFADMLDKHIQIIQAQQETISKQTVIIEILTTKLH